MTKDRILEETYKLVAKYGYDNITTQMIASSVGIKKPSLYNHFKNKEEIFLEMIDKYYKIGHRLSAALSDKVVSPIEYKERLFTCGLAYINSYKDNPESLALRRELALQASRNIQIRDKLFIRIKLFYEEINALFEYGKRIGAFNEYFDVKKNADFMMLVMQGIDNNIIYETKINVIDVWNLFVDSIFNQKVV